MEDIFLSFGFRLGVWLLLTASALGVLGLYWVVRRRERHVELTYEYQDLIRLCAQKTEEKVQLETLIQDIDERKSQRDRWQAEEARSREWLQHNDESVREIKETQTHLESLRAEYSEAQQVLNHIAHHRSERELLQQEVEHLRADRDKRSAELKEVSATYVSLLKDLDHRKAQLESMTDQFRTVSEDRARAQQELKQATEEYMDIGSQLQERRSELGNIDTELDQLQARAERFRMENPFLADHQDLIAQQWKTLEGQYQEAISRNRQQWQHLEEQFKRLRDQAQRSTSSLSL